MVRIAGVDRDVGNLELMWAQGSSEEKAMLAINTVIEILEASNDHQAKVKMKNGVVYTIKLEVSQ